MGVSGMDPGFWRGRRVLVTGHTGFKGSWLALWLLELGAELHGLALAPEPVAAPAQPLFEALGLAQRLGHYPRVLSGGEQQRVALARAFVMQPALLLADEPTGSLDHASGERIIELMLALNQERGTTLVMVTHDRQLAARCQRVLHMEAGRLKG